MAGDSPDRRRDDLERKAYSLGEAARDADQQFHEALLEEIRGLKERVSELESELGTLRSRQPGPDDRTTRLEITPAKAPVPCWTTEQEFDLCVQMRTLGRASCPACNISLCRGPITEGEGPFGISVPISCPKCGSSFLCRWDERPKWAGRMTVK